METDAALRRYELACGLLPPRLRRAALALDPRQKERVEELRLRVGQPLTVLLPEGEHAPAPHEPPVAADELERLVDSAAEFSRYAANETLRAGFLPVKGGFRVGLCGTAVLRGGQVSGLKEFCAVNIRIVREHIGAAESVIDALTQDGLFRSTLLLSPPGGGKTTLLRDLIRCLSQGGAGRSALRVSVIDERGEIAVCSGGVPQMTLGAHTDVLSLCPKAQGIEMVLRAMNPQVIAVDEIASAEEVAAIAAAANCGAALLATMHAADRDELRRKPLWPLLRRTGVFSRAVVLRCEAGERRCSVEPL